MTRIFESPDQGQTVYSRKFGEVHRVMHSQSSCAQHKQLWNSIHQAAESDSVLQQMLQQIELYHTLKNIP